MAYKLFNGKDVTLNTRDETSIKELLKVAKEVNHPLGSGLTIDADRGIFYNETFPYFGVSSYSGNICRWASQCNEKSLNEFVTELYKYKKNNKNN